MPPYGPPSRPSAEQIAKVQAAQAAAAQERAAIDALTQQILGQGTTSKWSGEGFGSAEANAADMAKILSGIGITDINQFGQVPELQKLEIGGYTYNGKPAQKNWDGQMTITSDKPSGYDENGDVYYPRIYLTPDQAAQVKPIYGTYSTEYQYVNDESSNPVTTFTPADQSKVVMNNGVPSIPSGKLTYGNKVTGQTVPNTYSERQTGNAWGGTFAGSGNTGYRVQFDAQGNPYFYTTGASSNDLANLLGDSPILNFAANVGAAAFGGPLGTAALQLAQGNDLGDAAKAALLTYGGQQVSGLFGDGGVSAAADADIAGGMLPEYGTNAAYDSVVIPTPDKSMLEALYPELAKVTPYATEGLLSSSDIPQSYIPQTPAYTPDTYFNPDYSLFSDNVSTPVIEEMGAQGLQVPENTSVADNVGYSTVDYSVTPSVPFEGLQMPTSPNLDSMGGGQGLTYQTPEGVFSQEGLTPTGTAPALGDPSSFINSPTVIDQAIASSGSTEIPKALQDAILKYLPGLFAGGVAAGLANQATQSYTPKPAYKPQDSMPTYSPDYFNQVQNYYTGYMPNTPRDVSTPLQDWYNTGYTGEDSVTKKLFGV